MPPNAIIKCRQRLVVPLGRDKARRIGCEVERVAREIEERFVLWKLNLIVEIAECRTRQDGNDD